MKKILVVLTLLSAFSLYAVDPTQPGKSWWQSVTTFFSGEEDRQYLDDIDDWKNNSINLDDWLAKYPKATSAERVALINSYNGMLKNGRETLGAAKWVRILQSLRQPSTLLTLAVGAGAIFALWHSSIFVKDIAENYIKIPPLAKETSINSWGSKVKSFFVYEDRTLPPRGDVILSKLLLTRAEMLTQSIINAAKNDTFFIHYLFYGPPGTGKTMLAKAMAQEAGLEYIYFPASKLLQYSLEDGLHQICHLFEYAKAYPKKLMIIMDEGDDIFAHRGTCSEKARAFLTSILTYMGTEQSDYVVITMSNRPKDFDTASLSRFGEKIFIGAPAHAERMKMFGLYAQKYFVDSHMINRDNRSAYQWLFSRKPKKRMPLNIAEDVFTEATFNELALRSDGLVGRDISFVMSKVQNSAYRSDGQTITITPEIIFDALECKKQQDIDIQQDFE